MGNTFVIIIIVIFVSLLGGILYLIYLPFKYILKRKGKLTHKLNRQIGWGFFLSLCLIGVVLFCFKDYRTSSKSRLEKISDVKLPSDFKVLKDEYHDMWQDYCILYDVQFDNNATAELIKSIQEAKFYNPNVNLDSIYYGSLFIKVGDVEAIWRESENGYSFSGREGSTTYSIEVDTLKNILNYNECLD